MKRIKDIILSDKTPMDKNSLWLKDGNLKYFEGVWKNIDTSKMSTNTSDIILDLEKCLMKNKNDDIKYLKNFIKQGETWAKNNGTYFSDASDTVFGFPVLMKNEIILISSIACSLNNETVVFPTSQYIYYPGIDSSGEVDLFANQRCIITGKIMIDLNKSNYCENTLDVQFEQKQEGLLEISLTEDTKQLSEETLTKIQNKLKNGPFSCIINGVVAFCRQADDSDRIIITISMKYGDPNADTSAGDVELYKNFDGITNFLIDYNTGEVLKFNQQFNGPLINSHTTDIGMVKQTSNIPVLPSNATLATVINSYNTLLTKLQDTGIMAKK